MDFSFLYYLGRCKVYYEFQIGSIDEIVELIVKVSDTECSLPYAQEMATQPLFFWTRMRAAVVCVYVRLILHEDCIICL